MRSLYLLVVLSLVASAEVPFAPRASSAELLTLPNGSTLDPDTLGDPSLRSAVYSFVERYPTGLGQDPATYGTVAQFERLYPDSVWESWFSEQLSNEDGSLAWQRSRDLMALVEMFEATGDVRYVERLWRLAQRVLAVRDDQLGKADYAGRSSPAWGTAVYGSLPRRSVYLVHSGLILEPLFNLLLLLDDRADSTAMSDGTATSAAPLVAEATPDARRRLLWMCLESLELFEPAYLDGPGDAEGHYVSIGEERDRDSMPQPFNRQNVMIWNFWAAHRLTGERGYADRARRLAIFFQHRLERTAGDFYLWDYEPPLTETEAGAHQPGEPVAQCDDISHAFYAIEPIPRLVRDGVVFDQEDLARFARTLTRSIHWGHGVFFSSIGCAPSFTPRYMRNLPGWLCVAREDAEARSLLEGFMLRSVGQPEPLHLAYLIRAK